jgi:serine/threonine protein kinase
MLGGSEDMIIQPNEIQLLDHSVLGGEANCLAKWGHTIVAVNRRKLTTISSTIEDFRALHQLATVTTKLRHPRVIRIYGICNCIYERWTVLECAELSLSEALADLRFAYFIDPIVPPPCHQWALDAAAALAYVHKCGFLHRAVSSRIFFVKDGRLKIADFTKATFSTCKLENTPQNIESALVRWYAPECFDLNPTMDEKSDVYSLGVVLWEIVTNEIPFNAATFEEVVEMKRRKAKLYIPNSCPQVYADIISQCWNDLPQLRPSADDVYTHLLSHLTSNGHLKTSLSCSSSINLKVINSFCEQLQTLLSTKEISRFSKTCKSMHKHMDPTRNIKSLLLNKYHKRTKRLDFLEMRTLLLNCENCERYGAHDTDCGQITTIKGSYFDTVAILGGNCSLYVAIKFRMVVFGVYAITLRLMTEEISDFVTCHVKFVADNGITHSLLESDVKILNSEQQ